MKKDLRFPTDLGMHIRAASTIAVEASKYPGSVIITYKGTAYNAKSILGLASSRIGPGEAFELTVEGQESEEMLVRVEELIHQLPR